MIIQIINPIIFGFLDGLGVLGSLDILGNLTKVAKIAIIYTLSGWHPWVAFFPFDDVLMRTNVRVMNEN